MELQHLKAFQQNDLLFPWAYYNANNKNHSKDSKDW